MPVWHEQLKDVIASGDLQVVGIIQEQHAERCRLFVQWHQIDWPILHDPLNIVDVLTVPIFVALDADGIVRSTKPTPDWVRKTLLTQHAKSTVPAEAASKPDPSKLRTTANSPAERRALGDAEILWNQPSDWSRAIAAYTAQGNEERESGTRFRLGVAYRGRWDSDRRQPGDFSDAVASWELALRQNPNHYIYRRRIQQYGLRLDKPYPFYDWIEIAQATIRDRGDMPIEITVPLSGAELASPSKVFTVAANGENPDPESHITEDRHRLIAITATTVPGIVMAGQPFRLHLSFAPNATTHWNNETPPAVVWLDVPDGWSAETQRVELVQSEQPESNERRAIDLEIKPPESASGDQTINGYVLYYICEDRAGQCLYLRQTFEVAVPITR